MMLTAPERVLEALQRVREDHPYPAKGALIAGRRADEDTATLWKRLVAAPEDERDRELKRLTGHEERVVLYGAPARLDDGLCLRVLARLFAVRQPEGAGRLAWEALLLSGSGDFRGAAAEYIADYPSRTLWHQLLNSSAPLEEALTALTRSRSSLEKWIARPEVELHDRPLVVRALQRTALQPSCLQATCQRESLTTVAQWVRVVFKDDERVRWYRDYLEATHRGDWPVRNPVLDDILERFGRPADERPFWAEVPSAVVSAVELWLRNRELTDLLGEGERVRFWRRFLAHMTQLEESRSGDAVFISFHGWFAIQYKEMGRATYLFESAKHRDLRWKDEPRLYNRILEMARYNGHIGRYEHRGYAWEIEAQAVVARVLRRFEGHS